MHNPRLTYWLCLWLGVAGCASDSYTAPEPLPEPEEPAPELPIAFDSYQANSAAGSRATGSAAADLIGGEFRVFAMTDGTQLVYDNYVVKWVSTPGTNDANVCGWDYLGYESKGAYPAVQDVKYWNFSASRYDFVAFAGLGDNDKITAVDANTFLIDANNMHTLYYANRVSAKPEHAPAVPGVSPEFHAYGSTVQFEFRRANARLRIGFYETIPGYAVKDLHFYYGDNAGAAAGSSTKAQAGLQGVFPIAGHYIVSYDADNAVHASFQSGQSSAVNATDRALGTLAYRQAQSHVAAMPQIQADGTPVASGQGDAVFLGSTAAEVVYAYSDERLDNTTTTTPWHPILPYEENNTPLTLQVDYTLVALDGTKETIRVNGAKATVPLSYCQWRPNHAYTYVFKISTHTGDQLYPITFDAAVSEISEFDSYQSNIQ